VLEAVHRELTDRQQLVTGWRRLVAGLPMVMGHLVGAGTAPTAPLPLRPGPQGATRSDLGHTMQVGSPQRY